MHAVFHAMHVVKLEKRSLTLPFEGQEFFLLGMELSPHVLLGTSQNDDQPGYQPDASAKEAMLSGKGDVVLF